MRLIFTLLCVSLVTGGCNSVTNSTGASKMKQGITGFVGELWGNQMPGPGKQAQAPRPLSTTVYAYELTAASQAKQVDGSSFYSRVDSRLVDSIRSDEEGRFALALKPGRYSIFVKVDGKLYANSFDQYQNIFPVTVEKRKMAEVNITVSDKASF